MAPMKIQAEIPNNLRSFEFILAWEEMKARFDWLNQSYWLHHFSVIGEKKALREIEKEIEYADKMSRS